METNTLQAVLDADRKKDRIIRFGRDYYIREATKSAGARKKLASTEDAAQEDQEANTAELLSPASTATDPFVFKAVPALVDTDSPQQTDNESSIEIASPIRPNMLEISSDSDLSIERVYNLHSGKVYEKIGDVNREITNETGIPEGVKYTITDAEFSSNKFATDENHNSMTNDRKRDFLRSLTSTDEDIYSPTSVSQVSSPVDDVFTKHDTIKDQNNVPLLANTVEIPDSTHKMENPQEDQTDNVTNGNEFSLEYSTDGYESHTSPQTSSLDINADPEIVDLKDKHVVKEVLGRFSKSYPNIAAVPLRRMSKKEDGINIQGTTQSDEPRPTSIRLLDRSVDDLRRRFSKDEDANNIKQDMSKQVYSLTARSIPREFREELKVKENGTEPEPERQQSSIVTTEEKPTEEKTTEEEPKVFPNARSRIKFFESLKR